MQPMIEIHYLNGRKRRIPETAFVADGESVTTVIDVGLDDLSAGLVLYYRHYAPARPDMTAIGAHRDPRGIPATLWNDSFVVAVTPEEMGDVEQVYYEGELVLFRFEAQGGLVNLHKVNKAQMLYLPGPGSANARLLIAETFTAMLSERRARAAGAADADELERSTCSDLGVPVAVVRECIDFQAAYALGDADYARRNGLAYLSDDGELVDPAGELAESEAGGGLDDDGSPAPRFDFSS